jgi:hypothetical protein
MYSSAGCGPTSGSGKVDDPHAKKQAEHNSAEPRSQRAFGPTAEKSPVCTCRKKNAS